MKDTTDGLLRECWIEIGSHLRQVVESRCELVRHGKGFRPDTSTLDPRYKREVAQKIDLLRRLDRAGGRPDDHALPPWLVDMIEERRAG